MKPSIIGSSALSKRVLSVLSGVVLLSASGCYTKLATDGDHWGYTGPVKQKVVVRETEDTVVIRETSVIHEPQPIVTDTLTYTNTNTGDQDVVVNNYYAPAPTFGSYDPWTNSYRTWYDDYWYRPGVSVSISIGDPYYDHHYHRPYWWRSNWRYHRPYYHAYWNDHYRDWWWYDRFHHHSRWAYYDPYWPYPGSYGCYPSYDPYWPIYGYGYYDYPYYGHHGHGHHHYDDDYDHDGRDRDGRERRRGNVGGEDRGRGSESNDNSGGNTGGMARDNFTPTERSTPIGGTRIGGVPVNTQVPVRDMGSVSTTTGSEDSRQDVDRVRRANDAGNIGTVQISTGEIPASTNVGRTSATSTTDRTAPAQSAPDIYRAPSDRRSANAVNAGREESRPAYTPTSGERSSTNVGRTEATESKPRAAAPAPSGTKTSSADRSNSSSVSSDPARSSTSRSSESKPTYSGSRQSSSPSYSGSRSSSSSSSSSGSRSSSSSGSSSGSSSRGSDSGSGDSRSDGGSRGRR